METDNSTSRMLPQRADPMRQIHDRPPAMRILQVIHQFPPFSSQGSEMHCLQLSRALQQMGHEVGVFHVSNTTPRFPIRLERRNQDGLRTFHCIDGGEYSRIADWPNPFLHDSFRSALAEFRPGVVHFHNYLSLGDDLVGTARSSGATILYTLHDFGLICPSTHLLQSDGRLCGKCRPSFFQDCCPLPIRTSGGRPPWVRGKLPSLARWRQFAANQRSPLPRLLLSGAVSLAEQILGHPESTSVDSKKHFYLEATQRLAQNVHRFIAPSAFLRGRFIECGFPASRVVHHRYGLAHFPQPPHRPSTDGKLRFGFIGAFHSQKGVQVLLEAFKRLSGRANLHIHGSSFGSPISEAHFRRITADPAGGFVVHGRYDNSDLGRILGGLDAVVVPSIWFENSPLTIQEAQIAGVPVITSNQGGMAELVRDGVDGLHFRLGDPDDLYRVLASVVDHPERLESLRRNAPSVPTIEEQAASLCEHYRSAGSVALA